MSRAATLPPTRVAPASNASVEAVLHEGDSPTQVHERDRCRQAQFRSEQTAAVEHARKAPRDADAGRGVNTAEDVMAGMTRCAADARQRIRGAMPARADRRRHVVRRPSCGDTFAR